jgi:acetyl-CoA/propionyl-CoA carboxylase biotin carboxyl carrier protein
VIKAVAGGGGKGMRAVRAAGELEPSLDAARREGKAAFGDARVLVERYLERPRHIEIQVLADAHGSVVHLGERECSLQRRHQKVIEEAPSPVADDALRARMGEAAVALARACGYAGAGTVEFIAPGDASEFFFLEMNTRLQVEHPVTELVYGVDLVEQQLRVAAGEPLALRQDELAPRGHAVEARLYAEDPANGFLPAVGMVRRYVEPEGVRMDSGIREGSVVGTDYDPMLAKVIAHAEDRPAALRRLARALGELQLLGVKTNAAFSRALLEREDVRAGEIDTGLLERILAEPPAAPPEDLVPAAALAAAGTARPAGPFRLRLEDHGDVRVADGAVRAGDREWRAAVAPARAAADRPTGPDGAGPGGALVRVTLDGVSRRYAFARDGDALWIARDGFHLELRVARAVRAGAGHSADSLEAPMPGTVLLVHAENGQEVEDGEVLVVIESMKMELSIAAPHAGTVRGLDVAPGDKVGLRQVLAEVIA